MNATDILKTYADAYETHGMTKHARLILFDHNDMTAEGWITKDGNSFILWQNGTFSRFGIGIAPELVKRIERPGRKRPLYMADKEGVSTMNEYEIQVIDELGAYIEGTTWRTTETDALDLYQSYLVANRANSHAIYLYRTDQEAPIRSNLGIGG
jgi:hypothetical protein